jgi:hypothetical protein
MKIKELPLIHNVDKIRAYKDGKKIADFVMESGLHIATQIERKLPRGGAEWRVASMSVIIEGILAEIVVLEIYF